MSAPFSHRTAWNRAPTDLALADPAHLLDLTISNPTTAGLDLAPHLDLAPLSSAAALRYTPDPLGLLSAREAVTRFYAAHHATLTPEQILLTASTSEAYSFLFHLLCDPGDDVLIAQPSYPLFDYLAGLADIRLRPYPLFFDHGWWIDLDQLERAITPRTRALVLVHPNNPTGHPTSAPEREALRTLCARHRLALIVDEVFLDYPLSPSAPIPTFAAEPTPVLTFVLSGLSKVAALPQMKLGWIATLGPAPLRSEALARLEIIADTFLSANTPAQLALPTWLQQAPAVQRLILTRLRDNHDTLAHSNLNILPVEAGWSAILRLPQTFHAPDAATALLQAGILTHPGAFFGIPEKNRVVLSLLTPPPILQEAAARLVALA